MGRTQQPHTTARVAPLDSVSQIPFVHRRNAPPPRAHSLGSLSRCGRPCLGSLGMVCSVLWRARFARSPNNGAHFKSQVSRFCCKFSLWGGAPRRLSRPRGRTCSKTERRLLCACYAPTSSSRAADELVTRRPSLSGTFAPAHTVQHKPMAVGATLALMS